MRISNYFIHQQRVSQLMGAQQRVEEARSAVTSGKRLLKPSDSPGDVAELFRVQSETAAMQRRQTGINTGLFQMKAGENALGNISTTLGQIRLQALQANNGSTGPDAREALVNSIANLQGQLETLANGQFSGRSLFAGTRTDVKPFGGSPVTYSGNDSPLQLDVGGSARFDVSVTGKALLNERDGTDLFKNLGALQAALKQEDATAITKGLSALEADMQNVTRLRGDMGSRIQYVQTVQTRLQDGILSLQDRGATLEGVDMAEAILDAQSAETAQQATLAMAGKLDGPSLLDYLR